MVWIERTYDNRGRLVVETRPHVGDTESTQGAIIFSYDSLDRPTRMAQPNDEGNGTRWVETQYGSLGDPGALDSWLSRSQGRVRGIRRHTSDGSRAALVRTFDAQGRLVSALEQHDQEEETPTTTYELGLGEPMAITGPDGGTLRTDFDVLGRARQTVDPSSGTFSWRYDGFGLVREQRDNDTLHSFEYDRLDRPVLHSRVYEGPDGVFGNDKSTTWEWDELPDAAPKAEERGKLLRVSSDDGYSETYTYGGPFALLDSATRVVPRPGAGPVSLTTGYEYDDDGRLEVVRYPGGLTTPRAQTYVYNERGALKSIDATMGESTRTIWNLDKVYQGRLPSEVLLLEGKLSQTYYRGTGALHHLTVSAGTTKLVDEDLRYNESGLLKEHEDLARSQTHSFVYDRFRRIEEKRQGTGNTSTLLESFKYSPGGRLEQKDGGIDSGGATLEYSEEGQSPQWPDAVKHLKRADGTLNYGYHPTYGLMTSMRGTFEGSGAGLDIFYDVDRQVRSVAWDTGTTRTLGYAPTGDRASMQESGGDIDSFVAYAGPHYERTEAGGNVVHLFRFTGGDGRVILEERVEQQSLVDGSTIEQSLGWQHVARDHRGSVAAILPDGGEVTRRAYQAFGASSDTATGTDLGYTGHRHLQIEGSPLGLIDMDGRMYDPLSAQFTRADPFMPNADTPKGFNRRAYVENDPINRVDPSGFCSATITFGGERNPNDSSGGSGCAGGGDDWDGGGPGIHWGRTKRELKDFFTTDRRMRIRAERRAKRRRDRRYKEGLFEPQGGGAAPNTSPGWFTQAASAVDRYQLTALNAMSEAITGAGDFLTAGGSQWVREELFGEGVVRTDTAASYVGAGAGFAISGGPQAVVGAVRAIPGILRALPGAVRALPGAVQGGVRSLANFLATRIGIPGVGTGGVGIGRVAPRAAALSAGAQRVAKFGHLWQKASLDKAIARHAGPRATSWVSATGKTIIENPATGRQVVIDPAGYFRIFQPRAFGSTKGTYLDMLGNVPNPRGVQGKVLQDLRQQATHFLIE